MFIELNDDNIVDVIDFDSSIELDLIDYSILNETIDYILNMDIKYI